MIKLAVISPSAQTLDALRHALSGIAAVDGIIELCEYPKPEQIEELAKTAAGSILLLDFSDPQVALRLASTFDRSSYNITPIAVFPSTPSREHLLELMRLGIREVITSPFGRTDVCDAVQRVAAKSGELSEGDMLGEIHAFLPAKPGAGATTVCASVAAAVARRANRRTLLLDFDLKLGVTSFLLKLSGIHSVADALSQSAELDDDLWEKLVGRRDSLEILGSAPTQVEYSFSPADYSAVLSHAQRIYSTTCVDLPGNMDGYEIDTMRRAACIHLVCTGDMTALHVAKRKIASLKELRVQTRISVLLNFAGKRGSLSTADIEEVIGVPVNFTLPCDETTIPEAVKQGKAIMGRSPLAARIEEIAEKIAAPGTAIQPPKVKNFIEYFSVSRARSRF